MRISAWPIRLASLALISAAGIAMVTSHAKAGDAWTTRVLDVDTVGVSFDECMQFSQRVLTDRGYRLATHPAAIGGYLGDYSAQFICAPRQVVVLVVVGPAMQRISEYTADLANAFLAVANSERTVAQ